MIRAIKNFIQWESFSGFILVFTAVIALIICNTPLYVHYETILSTKLTVSFGEFGLSKPFILWINDGLMAIFFLLVGLEIKRELLAGELNSVNRAILPAIAALGGMICPAIIYVALNYNNPITLHGWAIPTATDIAFALGVLTLLSSRIPMSLKIFLTAIAILDDLGAILVIAIFYTDNLSWLSLSLAFLALFILFLFNRYNITTFFPYALVGIILWVCVLESGVHATLAGVALAFLYPLKNAKNMMNSSYQGLVKSLNPWVAYFVLPLFAFTNAGLRLTGFSFSTLLEPIPLGIMCGLFFGKQIGIFSFSWACIKLKIAKMPQGTTWIMLYGVSILCGIGFTMSLFIGSLAFREEALIELVRTGVLLASVISGVVGYFFLSTVSKKTLHKKKQNNI